MPAFEYAISVGVDALELDMAVTKDNAIVVSHDPLLHPPVCTGPKNGVAIRELTLAELRRYDCGAQKNPLFPKQQPVPGTRMPTLDEVFALASKGTFDFNIETKIFAAHPEYTPSPEMFVSLVLQHIRTHRLEKRMILQSFDFRTLHAMKKIAPEIRRSALYESGEKSYVELGQESGATIISPHYRTVTKAKVEAAHKAGLEVVAWTANTPDLWDRLIDAQVDAIISDDPAELIAYLKMRTA